MKRRLAGLIVAAGIGLFAAGCDMQQVWYELCPEPHVATASTPELIAELIDRGVNS